MPKVAVHLDLNKTAWEQLEKITRQHTAEKRLVERAKIILKCAEGKTNREVAQALNLNEMTVGKWRKRYEKEGLVGLHDLVRSGKPPSYGDGTRYQILKKLEEAPPKGQASWDGNSLAKALNISHDKVWRVLRKEGVQLQRKRSWCVSTDPEFATKSADIIGLYLNPPENAIVICIDEKPSIQAIERKTGYVETSSSKIVRGLQSTYKRHGVLNLFAALMVSTGHVKTKTTEEKKRVDFQDFLEQVVSDIPVDQEIHIILDNYCTHKKNDEWLKQHPNVYFHYTPTSASWLNMVEIWFGILTRKALRSASFNSKESLAQAIQDFTDAYHENAKPFVWKKREVHGSQLKNTIMNLCN
jgi:transposase